MRRLFTILFLAVTLSQTPPPLPSDRSKQQEATQTDRNRTKVSPAPTPVAVINNQESTDKVEDKTKKEAQQRPEIPPLWDVAWSTWGLVAVGIGASLIAYFTLRDIKRQTKNTQTAAEAARKSTDALINAERAWLDGEFVRPPPDENRSEYSIYPRFDLVYFLKITNQGKTPALILNWEVLSDCRARVTTAEQQEMWSGEVHGDINELIGAGSFRTLPYPIDPPTTFYEWGEVETGEKSGVCKVTIRYLDLVTLLNRSKDEPPRETSFRCLWDVANRKFIRLPNYNHFS